MNQFSVRNTLITLLLCFAASSVQAADSVSCIWYAADQAIYQIKTDSNLVAQTIMMEDVDGLAMNGSDCGVSVLAKKTLYQFDANAVQTQATDLRTLNKELEDPKQLIVDPYDNSVWLRNEKTVWHLNTSGQLMATWATPGAIRSLALALDQSLWVLGNKQLWHYSQQGNLLSTQILQKVDSSEPKFLAIDNIGGLLWLAGEKQLTQINLNQPAQPTLNIKLAKEAHALALNPLTGELWLAASDRLLSFGRDGKGIHSIDLKASNLHEVSGLVFDPMAQALWLTSERAISRFTAQGQFIVNLATQDAEESLAVPAFLLTPVLSQLHPFQNGITNNSLLTITYGFDALCNMQSCGFVPAYFNSYTLTATLNTQALSPFVFDSSTGQTSFTPTTRLPEGLNSLSAQAKDGFLHATNIVNSSFTIDTIPPKFLSLTPIDGSTVTTQQINLQGVVDDITAIVLLHGVGQVNTSKSGTQLNFTIPLTLLPGLNTYTLSVFDNASNNTTQKVSITYQPNQVTANVLTPANGATINDDSTIVSGTFQGPPNTGITVNGIIAAQNGNQFYVQVPLKPGANTLTLTATTQDNQVVTKTTTVNSTGVTPYTVTASENSGVAPLTVTFTLNSQTTNTLQKIDVDFKGNGNIDLSTNNPLAPITYTYTSPGIYQAKLNITNSLGTVTQKTVLVAVQDTVQIDQLLKGLWSGMNDALVKGDKAKALSYFNAQGQEKYAPVFDALMPQMATIFASASPLQSMAFSQTIGEYAINRTIGGINRIFLIYFLKGDDGVWRLDSL